MDKLLDRAAVARVLDITTETLDKMCKAGGFARSITIGKRQRWREKELCEWLDQKFNEEDRS